MGDEDKKYEVKLGKWGTVTIAGVLGLLATNLVVEVQSCRNAADDSQVDAGVVIEDAGMDVMDADLGDGATEDSGLEQAPTE